MDSSNTPRSFSKSDTVIRRYPCTSVILCNREMKRSQYVRQRFLTNQGKQLSAFSLHTAGAPEIEDSAGGQNYTVLTSM